MHRSDRKRVERGAIDLADLFTIRTGEPVYDNVRNEAARAAGEIIKVKGRNGSQACRYYAAPDNRCEIYTDRPLECRLLNCWDTTDIEAAYAVDRLTRQELIGSVKGLWELIADHEERCSYLKLARRLERMKVQRDKQMAEQIAESINFDTQLRLLLVDRHQMNPDLLDFLLGRPMEIIFTGFGYQIRREEGLVRFIPG